MNISQSYDRAFLFVFGVGFLMLALITFLMIFFVIKYSRKRNRKPAQIEGHMGLEIAWTIIPTIIVMVMFWLGFSSYKVMRSVPENAMTVKVVGQKWFWTFTYPDGRQEDKLYVPVGQAVKLDISSKDVLHSVFIPAFHVKQDAVPGASTYLWFQADEEGDFDIFCAEYCGDRHAYMATKVIALNKARYQDWQKNRGEFAAKPMEALPPDLDAGLVTKGATLFKMKACASCHSTDGSKMVGPSLKGIWNHNVVVKKEGVEHETTVDYNYILRSLYAPDEEVVSGYNPGVMPSQKETLTEENVKALTEYIKSLN